ncbi:MAG: ATP-binding cassette domain-containing protein [Parvularculaceae bacterium]|jgi:ATP-binding cassette subfamily F protein uup|nr:ATP-binding cassette domain-containing protein [Parvularculaceae bacterium]
MPPLLQLTAVALSFGGAPLLEAASLAVSPGDRVALVGRNGSGKSTLLRIAAGLVEADLGERFVDPSARIAYLPQEPDFSGFGTVGQFARADFAPEASAHAAERLLSDLGLSPDAPCANLSGGEARRAALARILSTDPDILLLDEPTNHLDLPAIAWLEARLASARAGVVVISHDRRFLEALTSRTIWIDRGKTREIDRGFAQFETWRDQVLEEEETAAHKLDRKIAAEEHWVRYGVTARRKRNMRRMRELEDLRRTRREARGVQGSVKFSLAEGAVSGKRVIGAENISKSYGDRVIVRDFSIEIARGDRVGFVGPNGAGKTTLLNLLTGALAPDQGRVILGTSLQIVALDQRRRALDPNMRLADAIADGRGDWVEVNGAKRHVASYLTDFLFTPDQYRSPVSALSGGEKVRLALAAAFAQPSNLIVLDEPTNDLDLETLDMLEDLLGAYQGTALIVSHDRSFLDRVATMVVAPSPDGAAGRWLDYVGGYADMVAQRGSPPGFDTPTPSVKKSQNRAGREAPPRTPSKLSYKEKLALEKLPARIAALTDEVTQLKKALEDPSLFSRDAKAFSEKAARLAAAGRELASAEEEWLTLELKRESLGGSA